MRSHLFSFSVGKRGTTKASNETLVPRCAMFPRGTIGSKTLAKRYLGESRSGESCRAEVSHPVHANLTNKSGVNVHLTACSLFSESAGGRCSGTALRAHSSIDTPHPGRRKGDRCIYFGIHSSINAPVPFSSPFMPERHRLVPAYCAQCGLASPLVVVAPAQSSVPTILSRRVTNQRSSRARAQNSTIHGSPICSPMALACSSKEAAFWTSPKPA